MSPSKRAITRRDFFKLVGASSLGLLAGNFPPKSQSADLVLVQQGRVASPSISIYDSPSPKGKLVKVYWRDLVLPITNLAISDDAEAYNRVWYQIGDVGYAYSGDIQPVQTVLNRPVFQIPARGTLAEVTVPFTDSREEPREDSKTAYRLYYETTHWVMGVTSNREERKTWYRLFDDRFNQVYYARADHLRIIPQAELAPISPDVPRLLKKIEVRLIQQLLVAYEYSRPVFATRIASGARMRSGTYTTPQGTFMTSYKRHSRHMAAGDIASNGYDLPGVPWVMYITKSGISIHGTYWHNDFGRPRSHGCVNISVKAAKWLFRWTQPEVPQTQPYVYQDVGTYVEIIE